MIKSFCILTLFSSVAICSLRQSEKKIEKLSRDYENTFELAMNLESQSSIDDYAIFKFFHEAGLSTVKARNKINKSLQSMKVLYENGNFSFNQRNKLSFLLDNLYKVQNLIVQYATNDYAYYDIAAYYHYVDENQPDVVVVLMEISTQLMLPSMHGRGLYHFIKKINLDLRRLNALFVSNALSHDMTLKVNQLKNKLLLLREHIIESLEYQEQAKQTRWLKAVGLLIPVVAALTIVLMICITPSYVASIAVGIMFVSILVGLTVIFPVIGITIKELRESNKYQIPVHTDSCFSLFRPFLFPLTWTSRG